MTFIYSLESNGFIWYVGKTDNLARRKEQHFKRSHKTVGSGLIPKEYEFTMNILEETTNGAERERYWYETLKPILNKQNPNGTKQERDKKYYDANRDKQLEKHKEYYQEHSDVIIARATEWNRKNKERRNALQRQRYAQLKAKQTPS